ncbi:MAG: class I SAM-dependent methyltransferase [Shewanella sp.]
MKAQVKDNYQITVATFDKYAKQYQDKYLEFAQYTQTYDCLLSYLTADSRLFDISCGPGSISRYLVAKEPKLTVFGIDLAPQMIALAKQNVPSGHFEIMDCRHLHKLIDRNMPPFDLIACGFALPYLSQTDLVAFFAHLRALIAPQGIVYLSTMEGEDSRSGLQTGSTGDSVYVHYHQYDFIEQQLAANGFQIRDVKRQPFPAPEGTMATTDLFILAQAGG